MLFRRGWLKVFGPMLWYDLVRTGRRARTYLIRGAYLLILLAVLWMLYVNAWPHAGYRGAPLNSQIARFAENFLYTFLTTQYVLMVLLTPAYTAGAIAEEKQKKTIQFILATDLRNHEIVLGKLGSRMAHLGLLLLAGLPVLSAVQFLGGVDPHLILAGFAGTAVTLASTAGVGILASVVARPSRAACSWPTAPSWRMSWSAVWACRSWPGLPRQPFYAAGRRRCRSRWKTSSTSSRPAIRSWPSQTPSPAPTLSRRRCSGRSAPTPCFTASSPSRPR